jgi:hypothetical protein
MKKHPTGCCGLRQFQKWATDIYEGDDRYHKLDGCFIHETYVVQDVDGRPYFRCSRRRALFYLRKGHASRIDDGPIRLTNSVTADRLRQLYDCRNPFFMAVKNDRCVVCGVDAPLTRHHVVPRRVLRLIPNRVKRRMSNVLFVCVGCHRKYNENDIRHDEPDPEVWLGHFLRVMAPRHMPEGWHIFMIGEGVLDENGEPIAPPRAS